MRKTVSLILKAIVYLAAVVGLGLCFGASDGFMGGVRMLLYFTIQSNIWIAVTCLAGFIFTVMEIRQKQEVVGNAYYIVKFVFTVAITLTGSVYCFLLAPTISEGAWELSQVLVHVVVPVAAIADFLWYDSVHSYRTTDAFYAAIPPLYYLAFAGVGYVALWDFGYGHNYPYFFLNWGSPAGAFGFTDELPFMGVFYWILVMVAIVLGAGFLFIELTKIGKKA